MATHDYNQHPLPTVPPQGQHEDQYSYSSYDQSSLPQQPRAAAQQYQTRQLPSAYSHPQPQQQQSPQGQRPRSRGFSFRSDKSQKSGQGSGHTYKLSGAGLHETHVEKEAKRLHSKADPTLAMQEAEPSAVARAAVDFVENPPLSSLQHKDSTGAPIVEPDRSNPTRSRWERPLDTIRGFEAVLDGPSYSSRQSVYRAESDTVANWNRRSSYYGNSNGPRFPHESYYSNRSAANLRPESAMYDPRGSGMMGGTRDGHFDGADAAGYGQGNGARNRYSRMQPDPSYNSHPAVNRNVYPTPNNHRSYETVASGSGSASYGEPSGYQTDPTSSENSSINNRPKRQDPKNDYGISFGQTPGYRPTAMNQAASQFGTMPENTHGPAPPPKSSGTLLRKGSRVSGPPTAQRPDVGDKRKSWFSRRFSKNN